MSDTERARARALRGSLARRRYIADHGWRRRLLGEIIGRSPAEVAYTLGEHGKPRLTDGGPSFSASRSADIALYAVCESAEVGVDIEEIRPGVDIVAMARRFFSPAEQTALWAVPPARRAAAAHACWARKEAYAKALGSGLRFPLSEIEVWAGDGRAVRHGEVVVQGVSIDARLAAAVAVLARDVRSTSVIRPVRIMEWRKLTE